MERSAALLRLEMNTRCDTGKDALPRTAIFRPRQKSRATSLYRFALLVGAFIAAATPAAQFKFPNQTLTVPDGFEVERVAATPQVARPIYGAFDDQGHFYVVDSSGSNEKPDKQLQEKPHRIVRL